MLNHWILIGLLSASTYISRIISLEIMSGREMSPDLRLYFNYVPVGIMSALIIKQILIPVDGRLTFSLPVFIACLATAVAVKTIKRFLPSLMIGVVMGLLARYFLA